MDVFDHWIKNCTLAHFFIMSRSYISMFFSAGCSSSHKKFTSNVTNKHVLPKEAQIRLQWDFFSPFLGDIFDNLNMSTYSKRSWLKMAWFTLEIFLVQPNSHMEHKPSHDCKSRLISEMQRPHTIRWRLGPASRSPCSHRSSRTGRSGTHW